MEYAESAKRLYNDGFYCSQAVFAAFARPLSIPREQALKIGGCFGAGMCKGEVCGACSGALMELGLRYGRSVAGDGESQAKSNAMAAAFLDHFREENGSYLCRELLGCDLSTEAGWAEARQKGLFTTLCPELVASAARIAAELMEDTS